MLCYEIRPEMQEEQKQQVDLVAVPMRERLRDKGRVYHYQDGTGTDKKYLSKSIDHSRNN